MAAQRRSVWDLVLAGAFLLVMLKTPGGRAQQSFQDASTILLSLASGGDDSTAVFVPKDAADALEERLGLIQELEAAQGAAAPSYLPTAEKQPSASTPGRSASSPGQGRAGGSTLYSTTRNRAPLSLVPQGNTKGYNHDVGPHGSRNRQGGSTASNRPASGPQRGDQGSGSRPGGSVNYGQGVTRGSSYSVSGTDKFSTPQQQDVQVPQSGSTYGSPGSSVIGSSFKPNDGQSFQVNNNYGSQGTSTFGGVDSSQYNPKPVGVTSQQGSPGDNVYNSQVSTNYGGSDSTQYGPKPIDVQVPQGKPDDGSYGTQGTYGSQGSTGSTYGSQGSSYGSQGNTGNAYGTQGTTGSPYGSQGYTSSSYGSTGSSYNSPSDGKESPQYGPQQSNVQAPQSGSAYGSQGSYGSSKYGVGEAKQPDIPQQPDIYGPENSGSWTSGDFPPGRENAGSPAVPSQPGIPQQGIYNPQGGSQDSGSYVPPIPQGPSTVPPQRNNYVKGYQQSTPLPGGSIRGSTGSSHYRPGTDYAQYPSGPASTGPPYQPPTQTFPAAVPPSQTPEQYRPIGPAAPASTYDGGSAYSPATRTQSANSQRPGSSSSYPHRDISPGPDVLPPAPPPAPSPVPRVPVVTGQQQGRPAVQEHHGDHHGDHQDHHDGIKWLEVYGKPGEDFPIYSEIPQTNFRCSQEALPGFYADEEAQCQVFHVCFGEGRQKSFLCPNATIFNQQYFVCDWWQNVDCSVSRSYYGLNSNLYKVGQGPTSTEPPGGKPNMPSFVPPARPAPPVYPPSVDSYVPSTNTGSRTYGTPTAKPQVDVAPPAYPPASPGYTQVIQESLSGPQQGDYGTPGSPTNTQDRDFNTFGVQQPEYNTGTRKPVKDNTNNQQTGYYDQTGQTGGTTGQDYAPDTYRRPESNKPDTTIKNIHPAGPAKSADNFDILQGNYEGFVTNQFVSKPQKPSDSHVGGLPAPVEPNEYNQGNYNADNDKPAPLSPTDNNGQPGFTYGSTGTGTAYGSTNSGSANYGSSGSGISSQDYGSTKSGKPVSSTTYNQGNAGSSGYGISGSDGSRPSGYGSYGSNAQGYSPVGSPGYGSTGSGTASGYDNNRYSNVGSTNTHLGSSGYSKPSTQSGSSGYGPSISGSPGYGSPSSGYSGYGSSGADSSGFIPSSNEQSGYSNTGSGYSNNKSPGTGPSDSGLSEYSPSVSGPGAAGYGSTGSGYVTTSNGNGDQKVTKGLSYNAGLGSSGNGGYASFGTSTGHGLPGSTIHGNYGSMGHASSGSTGYGATGFTGHGSTGFVPSGPTNYRSSGSAGYSSTGAPAKYDSSGSPGYGSSGSSGYGSSGSTGHGSSGSPGYGSSGSTGHGSSGSTSYGSSGSSGYGPSQNPASDYSNSGYSRDGATYQHSSQSNQEQGQQGYKKPNEGISVYVSTGSGPFSFNPFKDSHSSSKSYIKGTTKPVPESLRFTSEDEPQPDEGAFEAPNTRNFNAPRPDAPGISSYGSQDTYEGGFKTPSSQTLTVPRPNPEVQSYTNYNQQKPYDGSSNGRNAQTITVPRPVQGDVTSYANQHDSTYGGQLTKVFSVPRPDNAGYVNSGYFEGSWSKPENQQGVWRAVNGYHKQDSKGDIGSHAGEHRQQQGGELKQRKYGYGK